jgi:hypothetical protein
MHNKKPGTVSFDYMRTLSARGGEFRTNEKAAGTHAPAAVVTPSLSPGGRGLLEAIKVHHFDPGRDKVPDKLRLRVRTSIDFRQSPELGV